MSDSPHCGIPAGQEGLGNHFSRVRSILLLGSGALKIGEAGEFDYSGSQAIKAFKEEGKRVILVNPNIATNQTSWGLADRVYFLPISPAFVTRIIDEEHPDALALSFGGQTALNCGLELAESGILERAGVQVLGTPIDAIRRTEDRALFKEELQSIGIDVPRSFVCRNIDDALGAAEALGYPVIARGSFALGGKGSGRAMDATALRTLLASTFVESPSVLIEEDLTGWKEIEY
ncbi:carbamoyl phosphate synthase large subunit, partial [Candidatus Peregrinibacteria bacterium]|nr:carbamoyl phosphate synthase large subunit [Candidatus Peregrinibacteria bacterium]